MSSNYPQRFIDLNNLSTKELNVVVEIEDSPYLFSLVPTYKKIRYGDPDIFYGDPGLVYGGLKQIDTALPILSIDSNFVISQKVEPEQGRASASTFSLTLLDKDGFMTNFISPGKVVNELLGGKEVKLWLGFVNSSFKEDYFVFFRGYVSQVQTVATQVVLQLTDANIKRRQQIFFLSKSALTADITDVQTTIPLTKTDNLVLPVLGPDATYDSSLKTYLRIDNELMEYTATSISGLNVTVTRGQKGTTLVAHTNGTEVANSIFIEGNVIDLALKLMLSGWGGPWISNVTIQGFADTQSPLGIVSNCIVLPDNKDGIVDYGLSPGDYITVSGVTPNVGTYIVGSFIDINDYPNKGVLVNTSLTTETTTLGVAALRSQYDTFPSECASKLRPVDIDVNRFQDLKAFFFSQVDNSFRIYVDQPQSGKEFIEKELFLPIGAYSVTRFGRISVAVTKPPIADDRSIVVDNTNVVDPQSIQVVRSLNNRRFFNEVQFFYDFDIDGNYRSVNYLLDTNSISNTIKVSSPLPISSQGLKTDLGAETLIARRGNYLLKRFKDAAYEIMISVNFKASALIEVSDVIALYDNGNLQISNIETGLRDLGSQLFEVIEKSLDLKTGVSKLKLLSSLGYAITDRFAGISPSSKIDVGSTASEIRIKESYGNSTPNTEINKWTDFIGETITVHKADYSQSSSAVFSAIDPSDNYKMILGSALSFTPAANDIVDISEYPTSTDPNDGAKLKLFFEHVSPSLVVVSGTSTSQFTLSPTDAARVVIGQLVYIRNSTFSIQSAEVYVSNVIGNDVYLQTPIAFTPSAGQFVELVGYKDGSGAYRVL